MQNSTPSATQDRDDGVSVTQADRDAAWPFRPSCYKEERLTREKWNDGVYDRSASVIRAFARHRVAAEQSARPPEATTSAVGEEYRRNNAELLASICQKARHSAAPPIERDEALRDAAAMLREFARQPMSGPSAPLRSALAGVREWLLSAPLESGYCCCGSPVSGHGMGDGHSPVDDLAYSAQGQVELIDDALRQPTPASPMSAPGVEAVVKHMANRFLMWRLPASFSPDAGISFKPDYNENSAYPMRHQPVGTNLFNAPEAEAMARHMLDGLNIAALSVPTAPAQSDDRVKALEEADIPFEIAELVVELGEVEWGATADMDPDSHGRSVADSVRITRQHFDLPRLRPMHGLYLKGTEIVVCHTGTSPNSPTIARALAGMWGWLLDRSRERLALAPVHTADTAQGGGER